MSVILGHIPVIPLLNAGILLAVFSVTVVLDQIKIAHQIVWLIIHCIQMDHNGLIIAKVAIVIRA